MTNTTSTLMAKLNKGCSSNICQYRDEYKSKVWVVEDANFKASIQPGSADDPKDRGWLIHITERRMPNARYSDLSRIEDAEFCLFANGRVQVKDNVYFSNKSATFTTYNVNVHDTFGSIINGSKSKQLKTTARLMCSLNKAIAATHPNLLLN